MDRHFFDNPPTLVPSSQRGLVRCHPGLKHLPSLKAVINGLHNPNTVSLICGGGAGHEPGTTGFVGNGLLAASVTGDTFASPSARQVYGAVRATPSDKGTILIITNYTGDKLHFGLACQQARADGYKNIDILPVGDDVSVGRTQGALVGRRAMAGTVLVCKILGAAAASVPSPSSSLPHLSTFDALMNLGRATTSALVSIGCTLGHCHVPGRSVSDYGIIPDDTVEIGLGLHNEPGVFVVSPQPPAPALIQRMLTLLLAPQTSTTNPALADLAADPERGFVPFETEDEVVLMVNNMGGMSTLELYAIADEVLAQLEKRNINPLRVYTGSFMGSLNAPGFSLHLLNLSHLVRRFGQPGDGVKHHESWSTTATEPHNKPTVETLLALLDAPHAAAAWPASPHAAPVSPSKANYTFPFVSQHDYTSLGALSREARVAVVPPSPADAPEKTNTDGAKLFVDPTKMRTILASGAHAVLAMEPDLTRWDTIVGDGDCGETCAAGAKAVLDALDAGLGSDGEVVGVLRRLTGLIDDTCGGTLGAIFSIFLAALTTEVGAAANLSAEVNIGFWGAASLAAIETLKLSTAARVGHRTVMDALIPFVEGLASAKPTARWSEGFGEAVERCREGGESTQRLVARLGRATYVGDGNKSGSGMPPDPGAMSVVGLVQGMAEGLKVAGLD
ncbi:hypothetical protein H0H81_004851 [Sphagnurus paluster]|uniref:Dihydroxyacetone kinase n=1 Tax=Sphagnurus paluster TaxID=117069 RepID=A0A9P7GKV6_9AGAR|nr:hypothetical protein H0H81_004851 [Sphagnurus paluster]